MFQKAWETVKQHRWKLLVAAGGAAASAAYMGRKVYVHYKQVEELLRQIDEFEKNLNSEEEVSYKSCTKSKGEEAARRGGEAREQDREFPGGHNDVDVLAAEQIFAAASSLLPCFPSSLDSCSSSSSSASTPSSAAEDVALNLMSAIKQQHHKLQQQDFSQRQQQFQEPQTKLEQQQQQPQLQRFRQPKQPLQQQRQKQQQQQEQHQLQQVEHERQQQQDHVQQQQQQLKQAYFRGAQEETAGRCYEWRVAQHFLQHQKLIEKTAWQQVKESQLQRRINQLFSVERYTGLLQDPLAARLLSPTERRSCFFLLEIETISRTLTTLYTIVLVHLLHRLHLNIVARHLLIQPRSNNFHRASLSASLHPTAISDCSSFLPSSDAAAADVFNSRTHIPNSTRECCPADVRRGVRTAQEPTQQQEEQEHPTYLAEVLSGVCTPQRQQQEQRRACPANVLHGVCTPDRLQQHRRTELAEGPPGCCTPERQQQHQTRVAGMPQGVHTPDGHPQQRQQSINRYAFLTSVRFFLNCPDTLQRVAFHIREAAAQLLPSLAPEQAISSQDLLLLLLHIFLKAHAAIVREAAANAAVSPSTPSAVAHTPAAVSAPVAAAFAPSAGPDFPSNRSSHSLIRGRNMKRNCFRSSSYCCEASARVLPNYNNHSTYMSSSGSSSKTRAIRRTCSYNSTSYKKRKNTCSSPNNESLCESGYSFPQCSSYQEDRRESEAGLGLAALLLPRGDDKALLRVSAIAQTYQPCNPKHNLPRKTKDDTYREEYCSIRLLTNNTSSNQVFINQQQQTSLQHKELSSSIFCNGIDNIDKREIRGKSKEVQERVVPEVRALKSSTRIQERNIPEVSDLLNKARMCLESPGATAAVLESLAAAVWLMVKRLEQDSLLLRKKQAITIPEDAISPVKNLAEAAATTDHEETFAFSPTTITSLPLYLPSSPNLVADVAVTSVDSDATAPQECAAAATHTAVEAMSDRGSSCSLSNYLLNVERGTTRACGICSPRGMTIDTCLLMSGSSNKGVVVLKERKYGKKCENTQPVGAFKKESNEESPMQATELRDRLPRYCCDTEKLRQHTLPHPPSLRQNKQQQQLENVKHGKHIVPPFQQSVKESTRRQQPLNEYLPPERTKELSWLPQEQKVVPCSEKKEESQNKGTDVREERGKKQFIFTFAHCISHMYQLGDWLLGIDESAAPKCYVNSCFEVGAAGTTAPICSFNVSTMQFLKLLGAMPAIKDFSYAVFFSSDRKARAKIFSRISPLLPSQAEERWDLERGVLQEREHLPAAAIQETTYLLQRLFHSTDIPDIAHLGSVWQQQKMLQH